MRSILLHIADDDGLEARLQVALDLARSLGGHIACLQATPYEAGAPGDVYGAMAGQLLPDLREAADALRRRFEPRLAAEDVPWSWSQEDGHASERLIDASCLSDLVVVGSRDPLVKAPSPLPGEVVLRARAPILLVPQAARAFDTGGGALVAWDGSPEACRALRAAVPLLARARSVVLASVSDGKQARSFDLPALDGAAYLSRHDIACEIVELPAAGQSTAQVLTRAAALREAAYLVMGAYGHMRLTELIWGGVTRSLFADPPLPILACH